MTLLHNRGHQTRFHSDTPRIVIAAGYPEAVEKLATAGVDFRPGRDLFLPSTVDGTSMRVSGMLMHPGQVWFVGQWRANRWSAELEMTLEMRLARGGHLLEDCHRIA